jgi:hypothetical protein
MSETDFYGTGSKIDNQGIKATYTAIGHYKCEGN